MNIVFIIFIFFSSLDLKKLISSNQCLVSNYWIKYEILNLDEIFHFVKNKIWFEIIEHIKPNTRN